ncbi:MAG: response regulator transcription factor [Chitinophagaceae bacterium]|nr:response regulator transcription factor [Chitinophagaceae bacterium]MBL0201529.1 response regulator transcription factor [Chitinophagaceae bacterium]
MSDILISLVDDQQLFRSGLAGLIKSVAGFTLLSEAENGKIFIEQLQQSDTLPHIALIDMEMPEMNGVELNAVLQKKYPSIKVLVLSTYNQERFIGKMIEAGACGYLTKNCEIDELVTAINTTHNNGFYFNQDTLAAMRKTSQYKSGEIRNISNIAIELTAREKEILVLLCRELSNIEIGERLFISPRTVEGHRNNLLQKTGCRNTAGLVIFAIKNNLFQVGL